MKRILVQSITLFALLWLPLTLVAQGSDKRAALFEAIEAGDQQAVLKILSNRRHVNLNHREVSDGETFLIEAIRADQPEIVRILLRHGADPNLREITGVDDHDARLLGNTPLAAALEADSIEMVRLLIQHGVSLRLNPSALHSSTSIEMTRFLLSHGALVDGRDENGETYLQTAVDDDNLDIVRLLLDRGANVNIPDDDGATPLFRCESVEIARLLIERGARVNAADKDGMTPLHLAAFETGRIDMAKLLIAHGADVNARDRDGNTPLDFIVADSFDYDFALLLVSRGARINEALVKEHGLEEEFEKIKRGVPGGI
jgi:ankyrin repeat protein